MGVKTYIPGAVDVANAAHRYLTRWQENLLENEVTSDQIAALAELITCLATFLSKWRKPPPV